MKTSPKLDKQSPKKTIVGWREWVAFPSLGVNAIKAKIDTGARSSALHAFNVEPFKSHGDEWVRFSVHPFQRDDLTEIECKARMHDERWVTNPGGRRQKRILIKTSIQVGMSAWPIEVSLTDRDDMGFRLLIGRTALLGKLIVDPGLSYRMGRVGTRMQKHLVNLPQRSSATVGDASGNSRTEK